jgi:hypothetical protein
MNEEIRDLLRRITELEDELRETIQKQQVEFRYRIEGTRIKFEQGIREAHRQLKVGLLRWLLRSKLRNVVTAPVIYAVFIPLAFLDLCVTVYQFACFPLYRVPAVRRSTYVIVDRHHLRYLNSIEKMNCVYCGYAGGVLAYTREIAARTEQYWCPIKHARKIVDQHRRYADYADFGDAEGYHATIGRLRSELAAERSRSRERASGGDRL